MFTDPWSNLKFLPGIKQRGRDSSCCLLWAVRKRRREGWGVKAAGLAEKGAGRGWEAGKEWRKWGKIRKKIKETHAALVSTAIIIK